MKNFTFSTAQQRKALFWLVLFHIAVIASSNYLVQFPFTVVLPNGFEVHSTSLDIKTVMTVIKILIINNF